MTNKLIKKTGKDVECHMCGNSDFKLEVFITTLTMGYVVCSKCGAIVDTVKFYPFD